MILRFFVSIMCVLVLFGPAAAGPSWTQQGHASWYGDPAKKRDKFHGKCVAYWPGRCVPFNTHSLVAAHRTLKFNTCVRVTNRNNSKSVYVRIIDRGPFAQTHKRVIDLSWAAMKALGGLHSGEVPVTLAKADRSQCS